MSWRDIRCIIPTCVLPFAPSFLVPLPVIAAQIVAVRCGCVTVMDMLDRWANATNTRHSCWQAKLRKFLVVLVVHFSQIGCEVENESQIKFYFRHRDFKSVFWLGLASVCSPPGVSAEYQRWAHSGGLHCCLLGKDHMHCCCTGTQGKVCTHVNGHEHTALKCKLMCSMNRLTTDGLNVDMFLSCRRKNTDKSADNASQLAVTITS